MVMPRLRPNRPLLNVDFPKRRYRLGIPPGGQRSQRIKTMAGHRFDQAGSTQVAGLENLFRIQAAGHRLRSQQPSESSFFGAEDNHFNWEGRI